MSTRDNISFLFVDGLEQLMEEYQGILMDETKGNGHTILFYGDTGSGKKMFSKKCIEEAKKSIKNICVIDLIDYLQDTDYSSEEKLTKVLELIENQVVELSHFKEISGKSQNPELFKQTLRKIVEKEECLLLIRFPKIETAQELYKYYAYLCMDKILLYFVTDEERIVNECRNKYRVNIKCLKCGRVKEGDGIKIIKNFYSAESGPKFKEEDIEILMKTRVSGNEMTIHELVSMIDNTYEYAKVKGIKIITSATVAAGAVYHGVI